jgi:hypothetical protein
MVHIIDLSRLNKKEMRRFVKLVSLEWDYSKANLFGKPILWTEPDDVFETLDAGTIDVFIDDNLIEDDELANEKIAELEELKGLLKKCKEAYIGGE